MHHDSEKSQSILSSITCTVLGLLKTEERRTKCMVGDIQNIDFQHDSDEVKGCNNCGRPCTARLDGLNHVILQHNEEIQ